MKERREEALLWKTQNYLRRLYCRTDSHPEIAALLNNLANTYYGMLDYQGALTLYKVALHKVAL